MVEAALRFGLDFRKSVRYTGQFLNRNIMAKTTPLEFLRQVRQEVGRVTWPTRKETGITTTMVFVMVVAAALFFLVVDQLLQKGVFLVLGIGA
jgi:preprotein translocase subunit SecE